MQYAKKLPFSPLNTYHSSLQGGLSSGLSTEHSHRPALQAFLQSLLGPDFDVINEPKRGSCGAPDYIVRKGAAPVFYVEAKDVGSSDLDGRKENREQFDRYKAALAKSVYTDYLDFHFYRGADLVDTVRLFELKGSTLAPLQQNLPKFEALVTAFATPDYNAISSAEDLAAAMAGRARLLSKTVEAILTEDDEEGDTLKDQWNVFRSTLVSEMTAKEFSEMYAQTVVYGLFAARLYEEHPETFSRQKASVLIPNSNPFLRKLFQSLAGFDMDSRVLWIVEDLCEVFRYSDVKGIFAQREEYRKGLRNQDPLVSFYEDFLSVFDKNVKKERGVWYTPPSVVDFQVRAVDDILKTTFGLPSGLADSSKVTIPIDGKDETLHRVQILDPATGTASYPAAIIERIHDTLEKNGQLGGWNAYVSGDLIPRLHGMEILMASYSMAFLKLDLLLKETGYVPSKKDERLNIYLTNSLEPFHEKEGTTLFARMLTLEARGADKIKRDVPVMVAIGNPPYSVSSCNKGGWITNLVAQYKKGLNEKNIQPLSDDYIKFLRLGQHYVEKNGEGILAYINANSYLDGIIHRQMRKDLLETFDDIYVLNLHGNSRKKETCPDGSKDENVFDIMTGVCINIFVKTKSANRDGLAKVHYKDLYGLREDKYAFLKRESLASIDWEEIQHKEPSYFFTPKDFSLEDEYNKGFSVAEMFLVYNSGIQTKRDELFSDTERKALENRIKVLLKGNFDESFIEKYNVKDSSSYKITRAIKGKTYKPECIKKFSYRPFEEMLLYYDPEVLGRPAETTMRNLLDGNNVSFAFRRTQEDNEEFNCVFATKNITDINILRMQSYVFPLYLKEDLFGQETMVPNFAPEVKERFDSALGREATPEEVFHYIYAVLHTPSYRERYREFLKIDFPKIPYPTVETFGDATKFSDLVKLGRRLRELHLMEVQLPVVTTFPVTGSGTVERVKAKENPDGTLDVSINSDQHFGNVPKAAWEMYIGGYQPLQKWLKDRKGRTLTWDDISHYQQMVAVLVETGEVMEKLENINSYNKCRK